MYKTYLCIKDMQPAFPELGEGHVSTSKHKVTYGPRFGAKLTLLGTKCMSKAVSWLAGTQLHSNLSLHPIGPDPRLGLITVWKTDQPEERARLQMLLCMMIQGASRDKKGQWWDSSSRWKVWHPGILALHKSEYTSHDPQSFH